MSIYTKQLIFVAVGILLVGLIGVWNVYAQQMLGLFAIGWMMMDIARDVFPENK